MLLVNSLTVLKKKIVERTVSIEKPASEKSVLVKTEKPLIDLPSQREKVMFRTSQSKMLEVVDKMFSDLKVKTKGTSTSTTCTPRKKMKLFLMNVLILILFLLFLLKRFSVMIFQKLKDLLETQHPCLLQKIGIQNLLLLICSLKKEFFKHSFLFLLISFMNGILMVCLSKKSLIK